MILILRDILIPYLLNDNLAMGCSIAIVTSMVLIVCYGVSYSTKNFLSRLLRGAIIRMNAKWGSALIKYGLITRLSYLAPAVVIYLSSHLFYISDIPATDIIVSVIKRVSIACMLFIGAMAIDTCLNALNKIYHQYDVAAKTPIKSYIQVVKILLYLITIIVLIAVLINKSPLAFFTGIGAMMAVILLIFRDSILGFVASVQLSAYDVVRLGDWIEMPNFGVDGDVIDISLNTVKVRNNDKTIVTVPTHVLISNGIKNWRGMREAGGRRIKRSINIDLTSIKFCDEALLKKIGKINLIAEYISNKKAEIAKNTAPLVKHNDIFNSNALTNLGCFRTYVNAYLRGNNNLHQTDFMFMVRHLQPTEHGLPLEVYVFSKSTDTAVQEEIQADIFDHIIASAAVFDLKLK